MTVMAAMAQDGRSGLNMAALTQDVSGGLTLAALTPDPRFIWHRLLPRIPDIRDKVSDNALVNPQVRGQGLQGGAGPCP